MTARIEARKEHLTDAELSQLLDGDQPGAVAEAHLGICDVCREELQMVQSSLASFRALSTAWAEMEAPRRVPAPARWLRGLQLQTSWGAGLAATAITGLLAFWLGAPGQQPGQHGLYARATQPVPVVPTKTELAADNVLLSSIDQELSEPGSPEVSAEQLHVNAERTEFRAAGAVTD